MNNGSRMVWQMSDWQGYNFQRWDGGCVASYSLLRGSVLPHGSSILVPTASAIISCRYFDRHFRKYRCMTITCKYSVEEGAPRYPSFSTVCRKLGYNQAVFGARDTSHRGVRSKSASQLDSGTALSARLQRLSEHARWVQKWRSNVAKAARAERHLSMCSCTQHILASSKLLCPLNLFLFCFFANFAFELGKELETQMTTCLCRTR